MPYYRYICKSCGNDFEMMYGMSEDSMTSPCQCGAMADKIIEAPGVMGLVKGPNMKKGRDGFQYHFDKPRPYEETLDQARKMEESGKMDAETKRNLEGVLERLKREKEAGTYGEVDYQKEGHPLERGYA